MGYMGARVLADRENVGQYIIIVDFGVIDPNVSAADEAIRNNARPRTRAMAAAAEAIADRPLEYHSYDEMYRTER
jgi:hypothetical protein